MNERIIPDIPRARAHWERRSDPIPFLLVPMSDGTVMRFNAEIPHPALSKIFQSMENMKELCVGYQRKETESL